MVNMYVLGSVQVLHVLLHTVSTFRGDTSEVVVAISGDYNESFSVITEGAEGFAVLDPELCVAPFAIEVLGQQLLHKGKHMLGVLGLLAIILLFHLIEDFLVCGHSIRFHHEVMVGILITELDPVATFHHCEDVDGPFVTGASDPVALLVKGNGVDLSLVSASPDLLERGPILGGENSDQRPLVTGCGELVS